jgi:hypothetical protein
MAIYTALVSSKACRPADAILECNLISSVGLHKLHSNITNIAVGRISLGLAVALPAVAGWSRLFP